MRKIQQIPLLVLVFCIFLCSSCGQKEQPVNPEETNAVPSVSTSEVTPLLADDFARMVFDFRNESEWKFLGKRPCIIDFYANWCRPCMAMAPVMEKLALEYKGKVDFYKVDVDQNRELAEYMQINGIPFLLYCPEKGMPRSSMGGLPEEELRKYIESIL